MLPESWAPEYGWKRNIAWQLLETWLPQGYSANSILNSMVDVGVGIRRQDFLKIAREVDRSILHQMDVRGVPRDQLIPQAYTTERNWQISENYLYRVNVFGTDPKTGEPVELSRLLGSNDRLTPNELDAIARDVFQTGSYPEIEAIRGAQPYGVIVREGFFD